MIFKVYLQSLTELHFAMAHHGTVYTTPIKKTSTVHFDIYNEAPVKQF